MRHDTQTAEVASDQEVEKVEQTEPTDRQLIPSDWPEGMRYYNESQMT